MFASRLGRITEPLGRKWGLQWRLGESTRLCCYKFAVLGSSRLEDLDPETVKRVIELYPRSGCGQALLELIISQVKRKPQTAAFTWMAEVGRCHVHGFACPTFAQVIQSNTLDQLH